jgi:hypothetical protein
MEQAFLECVKAVKELAEKKIAHGQYSISVDGKDMRLRVSVECRNGNCCDAEIYYGPTNQHFPLNPENKTPLPWETEKSEMISLLNELTKKAKLALAN